MKTIQPLQDIKNVWEASRFQWVLDLSQQVALGDENSLEILNGWMNSWLSANPPYRGVNWGCGQEASIRVLHLAAGSRIIGSEADISDPLKSLITAHVKRIWATKSYALAQNNNHAITESAALFVAGWWLIKNQVAGYAKVARKAQTELETQILRLVSPEGEFAQHSLTYQRLVLDVCSFVETWRIVMGAPPFKKAYYTRLAVATSWLLEAIVSQEGDGPNYGGNDGALILNLWNTDYRDFRPTSDVAKMFFLGSVDGSRDYSKSYADWYRVQPQKISASHDSGSLPKPLSSQNKVGLVKLSAGRANVFFRKPGFTFRPANSDILNVDLWLGDSNVIRDAGSLSYAQPPEELARYHGASGHNVIQFDDHDQMPRVSRFLYGEWPKARATCWKFLDPDHEAASSYKDFEGNIHSRKIRLDRNLLTIIDVVEGPFRNAVLRWRLIDTSWKVNGNTCSSHHAKITVDGVGWMPQLKLVEAPEARYYQKKVFIPCLEVSIERPCTVVTKIGFPD